MNLYHLPSFDESLADSAKLASIAQQARQAIAYAEKVLETDVDDMPGDSTTKWACYAGKLEAAVDILAIYMRGIADTVKPEGTS